MIYFPFEKYRKGQELMINEIIDSLKKRKDLLIHAPTGIGKTAAIFSSLLPFSLENNYTIFFLTSKTMQHEIAISTLEKIKDKFNLHFEYVNFIGKYNLCLQSKKPKENFHDFCDELRRRGECIYYENFRKFENFHLIFERRADKLKRKCSSLGICPYETISYFAKEAKVIICDYNYVFAPFIRRYFFKRINKDIERSIIVIDEAHSLEKRLREMFSVTLNEKILKKCKKELEKYRLIDYIENIEKISKKIKRFDEGVVSREEFLPFVPLKDYFEEFGRLILMEEGRSYLLKIAKFLNIIDSFNEGYAIIKEEDKVKLHFLDLSLFTKPIINNSFITIAMSGTLKPLHYYAEIYGFDLFNVKLVNIPNPFPLSNRLLLIYPGATSKYSERKESLYKKIANELEKLFVLPYSILVYFPSYEFLDNVRKYLSLNDRIIYERKNMSKEEKYLTLERLKKDNMIFLANSSGNFSESVNVKGPVRIVIIVGLPLEKPSMELETLSSFYNKKFGKGFEYAYLLPAIRKVKQALGRLIRSEKDIGVGILMDYRYLWKNYRKYLEEDFKITFNPLKEINSFISKKINRKKVK